MRQGEAFSRVKIDAQLRDVGWRIDDGQSVHFEYVLADGTKADYVLFDHNGRSLAVVEAKKASTNPVEAEDQALHYAKQLHVPFAFLANGEEVWFWEHEREAHPHKVTTFFSQADLERHAASYKLRRDPLSVPIDKRIVDRDYQHECINTLCREMKAGRRKMLVEMATGTGKTRTAAALIKRLFEANVITRVLFLVDRISLATQADDAFADHIPEIPSYILKPGQKGFRDEKRITVTTLQSMVNIYRDYSAGYFDLIISDECHRSIYGEWRGVLEHFDGVQIGLTATPCKVPESVLNNLPDEEDKLFVRDTLRFFEVEEPTFRYTLKQAISEGYLLPYHIYKAMTVKTAAEGSFPVTREELDLDSMNPETKEKFEELFGDQDQIDVDPGSLERLFTIPERNRAIVREFRNVLEKGYQGPDGVNRKPLKGKTIVFAVNKRHAVTLAQMFDKEFAHEKDDPSVRYADYIVSGTGRDDSTDAATKIQRFKNETYPQILVSVNMLDTGFDCPEVVNLVMARFTKSSILYQQMRGRGTRRADHINKPMFTIFDFTGVTDFHGDDEAGGEGGFVIPPKPRTHPPQPRKLLELDIHDHIDPTTRGWITLDEEGNEVRTEAGEARALELGMRFEQWMLHREARLTSEQARVLRMVGEQIEANATDMEAFEIHRFAKPPFSLQMGLSYVFNLFGGEENTKALLDDLNAAVFSSATEEEALEGSTTHEERPSSS